ncbi:MAG TPA: hypothetical protein PLQ57_06250 [Saprospiraceae bacterium]|nr:hypothetical protein [Saprospiraceae bacterium]
MKKLLLSLCLFSLVSCGSYKTEMWFYADGSGKTNIQYDLGAMIKEMKAAFEGFGKQMAKDSVFSDSLALANIFTDSIGNDIFATDSMQSWLSDSTQYELTQPAVQEEAAPEPEMYYDTTGYNADFSENYSFGDSSQMGLNMPVKKKSSVEKFVGGLNQGKVDTSVVIYTLIPDSVLQQLENPGLLKQVNLEIHLDSAEEKGVIDLSYTYKNLKEANKIGEMMARAEIIETGDTTSMKNFKRNFNSLNEMKYDPKAGILSSPEENAFEMGMLPKEMVEGIDKNDEESFGMILDIMGMDKIEVIYHLPRKIKEVKGVEYEQIDDDTIKLRFDMRTMFKTGKVPGYEIRF